MADSPQITQASAAIFFGPGKPLKVERHPLPQPGEGEILARVQCTTICASDLHTVHGRRSGPCPCVLGHEIVGTITAFGPHAPRQDLEGEPLEAGQRITWTLAASCGHCRYCTRGLPQKCESLVKYGHAAIAKSGAFCGGYAEYCLLVPGTGILRLPDSLPDGLAATANCTASTVAASLRLLAQTTPLKGSRVLVMGAGALGLTACAMLREAGAGEVWCCDLDATRARRALQFGASRALLPSEATATSVDAVLEFTGAPQAAATGIDALRTGGSIILVGAVLPTAPVEIHPEQVVRGMLTIRGLHNYAPQDLVAAVRFLDAAQHRYPLASLVAQTYGLEAINEALQAAANAPGYRVAIVPG